jgi:Flp pilus assembly protein TadD
MRRERLPRFRKAIALNPNNADSRYHLGCDLLEKGDFDGAIREFREAKRIAPARVDARQNPGCGAAESRYTGGDPGIS